MLYEHLLGGIISLLWLSGGIYSLSALMLGHLLMTKDINQQTTKPVIMNQATNITDTINVAS